ncbi:MAG: hypothetical protein A2Y74_08555 [Actinobacteria bacterium RBG_13_63_9]|nr:MAG: hypothetical protein A2Y74_08555 [Actinobacteria bacterium RBG_13_63_9]
MSSRSEKAPEDDAHPPNADPENPNPQPTGPADPPVTLLPPASAADGDWATWADLCEPQGHNHIYTLPSGKKIEYTDFVHLDRLASLRMSAMVSGKFDNARFSVLLLKEVLIRPRIETEADLRLAMKADGVAMMEILGEVQRINVRLREVTSEALGESSDF